MLIRCLMAEGHTCDEAEDGEKAVEKIRSKIMDDGVIKIVDGKMDKINGNSFTDISIKTHTANQSGIQFLSPPPHTSQPLYLSDLYDVILMDFVMPLLDGPQGE